MHIPDGMLSMPVAAATWATSAAFVGIALRKSAKELDERQVPLLGVSTAFVYAGQMLNFPIAAGTSGHFLGATLVGVILGPWSGLLVMTLVLSIQCLVHQDGGLSALGANIFNMGIIGCFLGYGVFTGLRRILPEGKKSLALSGTVAAWIAVVTASIACAVEISVYGNVPYSPKAVIAAMAGVHSLIGIGEAMITAAVLGLVLSVRPDLLRFTRRKRQAEVKI